MTSRGIGTAGSLLGLIGVVVGAGLKAVAVLTPVVVATVTVRRSDNSYFGKVLIRFFMGLGCDTAHR